jgi:hypothetical protein
MYVQSLYIVIDLRFEAYSCCTKMQIIMSYVINADFSFFLSIYLSVFLSFF